MNDGIDQLSGVYQWLDSRMGSFPVEDDYWLKLDTASLQLKQTPEGLLCIGRFNWDESRNLTFDIEKLLRLAGLSIGVFTGKLAIDPTDDDLCLIHFIEYGCEYTEVEQVLEQLANQLDVWMQCLQYPQFSTPKTQDKLQITAFV